MVSVLITGGTGSLGRELVRQLLGREDVTRVVVYSRDEWKQWEMRREIDNERVRWFIGDVRDSSRLIRALSSVDLVVHAAALKQVVSCEYNPIEAVRTNVDGAVNVIEACLDAGVKRCIGVSSDKAVHPVNVYGATKMCAEKLFVQGNAYAGEGGTEFSVVRYGNVLGSRGSVVPLWREEVSRGVPLSVTNKSMTRFWITIAEAAEFVLKVLFEDGRGWVRVPRMPSVRLKDMINIIGNKKGIQVNGVRPGEKIHESLISEDEGYRTTTAGMDFSRDTSFAILPENPSWAFSGNAFQCYPKGWSYRSDTNDWWLEGEELKAVLEGV